MKENETGAPIFKRQREASLPARGQQRWERHYSAAMRLHGRGRLRDAIREYSKAISFNADHADAYFYRGLCYYELGQPRPENAAPSNRARQLLAQAIQEYSHAVRLDPRYGEAYYNRALACATLGRFDEAEADIARLKELGVRVTDLQGVVEKLKQGS